jgi:hypothetical protein
MKLTKSKAAPPGARLGIASVTDPQAAEVRKKLVQAVGDLRTHSGALFSTPLHSVCVSQWRPATLGPTNRQPGEGPRIV